MNLYIGDTHFGHSNVLWMDSRPYKTVEEMDEDIIRKWNSCVKEDDDVWFLGDLCCRSKKKPQYYLEQLNGKKHLLIGNHDGVILKNLDANKYFESIDMLRQITDGGKQIIMCHYPLAEWPMYFRGAIHIYGHIHNNSQNKANRFMLKEPNALNAGCMINGYKPCTLQELIQNNNNYRISEGITLP